MKKKLFYFAIICFSITVNSQEKELSFPKEETNSKVTQKGINISDAADASSKTGAPSGGNDIGLPANSPFQLGHNTEGSIQNSINQNTGKVNLSIPLASISAGDLFYNLNLSYSSHRAFETAKKTNKYAQTTITGLGWDLNNNKIIVDHKSTGTRDDDEFYMQNGSNRDKLICTSKTDNGNTDVWTYVTEKYNLWKFKYHFESDAGDYWEVIKDNGSIYIFGSPVSKEAKEYTLRYGNWIGNSKQSSANVKEYAIAFHLYQIKDQWNNNLTFEYIKENQYISGKEQTEASYLKEINSSNGSKVTLNYGYKNNSGEYYEPHKENSEPDAYHERYEKRFLNSVSVFNKINSLVNTHTLNYTVLGGSLFMKRYLTSLLKVNHKNGLSKDLPLQTFEYYTSGNFKGGLKKMTYPTGGKVTYSYESKFLFANGANRYVTTPTYYSGYTYYATYVNDNYAIKVYRSTNPVFNGKYRFKFVRNTWNGTQWVSNEFTLPNLLLDNAPSGLMGGRMEKFQAKFNNNFYAFSVDNGSNTDVYLFHLNKDGRTWNEYSRKIILTNEPRLLSGSDFIALGSRSNGRVEAFRWNGEQWNLKTLLNGNGEFYYAAINNYILCLNEDGGADRITGVNFSDNYYFHYLDASKKWRSKSWSATLNGYLNSIEKASFFYPDNAMTSFVADDNPEVFLRWDVNYNIIAVDNIMGYAIDDHPLAPSSPGMYTLYGWFTNEPFKTARFNGVNWVSGNLPSSSWYYSHINFGNDVYTFQGHDAFNGVAHHTYNPNTNSWSFGSLGGHSFYNSTANGINKEFTIAGRKIFKKSTQPLSLSLYNQIGTLQYSNYYTFSDGLSHSFVEEATGNINFEKSTFLFVDKTNNQLSTINLGAKKHYTNYSKSFGGNSSFMSPKTMWLKGLTTNGTYAPYLYRIIDDRFNDSVYDIVADKITIDNNEGHIKIIEYTYNEPSSVPNNELTFYGEVTVKNKGGGTGNIGKVISTFKNGSDDLMLASLPIKIKTYDANNILKKEDDYIWKKIGFTSQQNNKRYLTVKESETSETFFDNGRSSISEMNYEYNSQGLLNKTSKLLSSGLTEITEMKYPNDYYSSLQFLKERNIVNIPYETIVKSDNQVVGFSRNVWIEENGKARLFETYTGPNQNDLRKQKQISKVDDNGLVLEVNNGKGIFASSLFGYQNVHEVAVIANSKHQDVLNQLDVSYTALQNLPTAQLKLELLKLYDRLPNSLISLTFYDDNGRVINRVNQRKENSYVYYDIHGRIDYITDAEGNVLQKKEYNFSN